MRGEINIDAVKRSMDDLSRFKQAELVGHQVCKELENMLYDDQPEPSITLNREDIHVLRLITKHFKPATVGNYLDTVMDDEQLQHWTDRDREACMTKLQNLGLVRIKTAESMGAVGMRESSMRGE